MTRRTGIIICTLAAAALYVASYVPLSLGGAYAGAPRGHIGRIDWQPAAAESRFVRALYAPLVTLDRRFVHRSYHRC